MRHHGSSGSTSKFFLEKTSPAVALISCGKQGYCHPDDLVIERLCNATSIQRFYLTNCYFNRCGVNPDYTNRFAEELKDWMKCSAGMDKPVKKLKGENNSESRSADNLPKQVDPRPLLGILAGNQDNLGTIVIRASASTVEPKKSHSFDVGYYDGLSQQCVWRTHTCGGGMAEKTANELTPLVNIATLAPDAEDSWRVDLIGERKNAPYSLLTKPPGEKKSKEPLRDDEDEDEDESNDEVGIDEGDESDWEEDRRKAKKSKVKQSKASKATKKAEAKAKAKAKKAAPMEDDEEEEEEEEEE